MRVLIQRVTRASVSVEGKVVSEIAGGLLAFAGFRDTDTEQELEWMARKLPDLRIFEDAEGKMNLSVRETGGSILVVSQFTLYGDSRKGNRPNFMAAARPEVATKLYQEFARRLGEQIGEERVREGVFQAMMDVELVNSGPVTLMLEREAAAASSKNE
jgi:D-aminoacyl-tRNA deacylase